VETVAEMESRVNQMLEAVTTWMKAAGLKLVAEKTEAVLLTRRRKLVPPVFRVGGVEVEIGHCLKYLGLWFDGKLSFREREHFRKVADEANRKLRIRSMLMTNPRGPREVVRRVYANLAHSVLLYGVQVWANAAKVAYRRIELEEIQRRAALRCVCAYRTAPTVAVCILARMPPIDLLIEERVEVYREKKKARIKNTVLRMKKDA